MSIDKKSLIKSYGTNLEQFGSNNSKSIFVINTEALIDTSHNVIKAYPFFYEREIDMLQRFFVQISEEVQEFRLANWEDVEDTLSEYSDIILYLFSMLASYKDDTNLSGVRQLPNIELEVLNKFHGKEDKGWFSTQQSYTGNQPHLIQSLATYDYEDFDVETIRDMISTKVYEMLYADIRMKYPERKYHKPIAHDQLVEYLFNKDTTIKDRANETRDTILELIGFLLAHVGNFIEFFEIDYTEFFEILLNKLEKNVEFAARKLEA